MKNLLYLTITLLILLEGCKGKPKETQQIGSTAPSFTLKDVSGGNLSLDNFKGRVVLLRFWATRCDSCKVEMPKLEKAYRKLISSGFIVLAVNVEDTPEKAAEFVREIRVTYPALIDKDKDVSKKYEVYGVPTSFIIDKNGTIRERIFGDLNEEAIETLAKPYF